MKKIAALLLTVAFGLQTFSQGITILDFYINQSYITKNKCVNRYRPMLHCNGKCQLAQKIKQQEQKEQQNPELKLAAKNEVLSSRSFFATMLTIVPVLRNSYNTDSGFYLPNYSASIFHPPQA
jgi:hypothetical protein